MTTFSHNYLKRPLIILFFLLLLLLSFASYAQLQNYLWYFGSTLKGLKFDHTSKIPSITTYKYTPYTNEGCSVVSDPITGKLLFYTDGIRVVDASDQVVPNGNLLGDPSNAQEGIVCLVPNQCNKYYIFSGNANAAPGNVYYSVMDMTLTGNGTASNPLGNVTATKNVLITGSASEAMALVSGITKGQYWLFIPLIASSSIKIYSVNSSGINLISTYNTGVYLSDQRSLRYCKANNKLSLASVYENDPVLLMDINLTNGALSNVIKVPGTPLGSEPWWYGVYDTEWSPDGSKLYISKYRDFSPQASGKLYQYDLNTPASAPTLIYAIPSTSLSVVGRGLKAGPDNKIYWLYTDPVSNTAKYIAGIDNPNNPGTSCNINVHEIDMGDLGLTHKFPEFLVYNNQKPQALNDFPSCINQNDSTKISVLANDSDPDGDSLLVSVLSVKYGTAQVLSNKQIKYTPASGFSGNDTIQYIITDSTCFPLSDTAFAVVCVNTVPCNNNPPSAVNDVVSLCIDLCSNVSINILANDSDPDGNPVYASLVKTLHGKSTLSSDSVVQYVPDFSYAGADTIYYLLCDSASCSSYCRQAKVILCTSEKKLLIPNLITPNGDRVNDKFEVSGICEGFYIEIYNRWGELIFKASEYHNNWGGENENDGMYYYMIRDQNRDRRFKGWVNVLR